MGNNQQNQIQKISYEQRMRIEMQKFEFSKCYKHKYTRAEFINFQINQLVCRHCKPKNQVLIEIEKEMKYMDQQLSEFTQIRKLFQSYDKELIEIRKLYQFGSKIEINSIQEMIIKQHIQSSKTYLYFQPYWVQQIQIRIYKEKKQIQQEKIELEEFKKYIPQVIQLIQQQDWGLCELIRKYAINLEQLMDCFDEIKLKSDFIYFFQLLCSLKQFAFQFRIKDLFRITQLSEFDKPMQILLVDQNQERKLQPIESQNVDQQKSTKIYPEIPDQLIQKQILNSNQEINQQSQSQPNTLNQEQDQNYVYLNDSILGMEQSKIKTEDKQGPKSKIKITQINEEQEGLLKQQNENVPLQKEQFIQIDVESYYYGTLNQKGQKHGQGKLMIATYDEDFNPKYFYFRGHFQNDEINGEGIVYYGKSHQIKEQRIFTQQEIDSQYFKRKYKIIIKEQINQKIEVCITKPKQYWTKYNQVISEKDIFILNSKQWLNSSIIDAYVRYLCMQHEKSYLKIKNSSKQDRKFIFESHIMTVMHFGVEKVLNPLKQYIDQFEAINYHIWEFYHQVGFVINQDDKHWYFAKVDFIKQEIIILDSCYKETNYHNQTIKVIKDFFQQLGYSQNLNYPFVEQFQQDNSVLSGYYTCLSAFQFMNPYFHKNMEDLRNDLLEVITK